MLLVRASLIVVASAAKAAFGSRRLWYRPALAEPWWWTATWWLASGLEGAAVLFGDVGHGVPGVAYRVIS